MRILLLWHPESPGEKVVVFRNWWQRLIYPKEFATLEETLTFHALSEAMPGVIKALRDNKE